MNLQSKSKRALLRYVQLLRRNLKAKEAELSDMSDCFYAAVDRYNALEFELENEWHKRLADAEKMHRLKTVNLLSEREHLIGLLTKSMSMEVFSPLIIKPLKLDWKHPNIHEAADEFWRVWKENGAPHKHGFYESTWMSIDAALIAVRDVKPF